MIHYNEVIETIMKQSNGKPDFDLTSMKLKEVLGAIQKQRFIEISGYLKSLSFWDRVKILFGRLK